MILHRFNYKGDHITLKEAKRILAEQGPSVLSPKQQLLNTQKPDDFEFIGLFFFIELLNQVNYVK